jgi:hypothetical protein
MSTPSVQGHGNAALAALLSMSQTRVRQIHEGFYTRSPKGFDTQGSPTERRRANAIRGLDRINSPFAGIAKKRRFGKGQNGSTFPWANTAAALHTHGPLLARGNPLKAAVAIP